MNKLIEELFNYYEDNVFTLTDIESDPKYIEWRDRYSVIFDKIADIIRNHLDKQKANNLLTELESSMYRMERMDLKYAFQFAFLSGVQLGMESKALCNQFKQELEKHQMR